jgi:hypothetical protein
VSSAYVTVIPICVSMDVPGSAAVTVAVPATTAVSVPPAVIVATLASLTVQVTHVVRSWGEEPAKVQVAVNRCVFPGLRVRVDGVMVMDWISPGPYPPWHADNKTIRIIVKRKSFILIRLPPCNIYLILRYFGRTDAK